MAAAMPDIAYGLETEIIVRGRDLPIGKYGHDPFDDYIGSLPSGQTHFPGQRDRYSIGTRSEFQELSKLFQRDFWHAAGLDPTSLLEIDFDRALQELGLV